MILKCSKQGYGVLLDVINAADTRKARKQSSTQQTQRTQRKDREGFMSTHALCVLRLMETMLYTDYTKVV